MFAFAYLLFTNIAMMAGILFALVRQSRSGDDELAGTRLDRGQQMPTALFARTRHAVGFQLSKKSSDPEVN